jgi:hypothetical protein
MTSALIPADRRLSKRYNLDTALRYRTANGPLNTPWKQGRALNMSANGILIQVPESLAIGAKLEITMDWTGLYHGRQAMRLTLIAAVARTDSRGSALRILHNRFRDVSPTRVKFQRVQKAVA